MISHSKKITLIFGLIRAFQEEYKKQKLIFRQPMLLNLSIINLFNLEKEMMS